jgi:hypothetical protein
MDYIIILFTCVKVGCEALRLFRLLPCGIVSTPPSRFLSKFGSGLPSFDFLRTRGSPNSPRSSTRVSSGSCHRQGAALPLSYPGMFTTNICWSKPVYTTSIYSPNLTLSVILYTMIKMCKKHGQTKHFPRPDGALRCGKCASEWVINHRRQKKEKLVEMFGGKCIICGYNKYAGALDFHHTHPENKSFALSVKGLSYSWDSLLKEAEKCVLVCKNCHTEIESGMTILPKRK